MSGFGAFDDLVPKKKAQPSAPADGGFGAFSDLVPQAPAVPPADQQVWDQASPQGPAVSAPPEDDWLTLGKKAAKSALPVLKQQLGGFLRAFGEGRLVSDPMIANSDAFQALNGVPEEQTTSHVLKQAAATAAQEPGSLANRGMEMHAAGSEELLAQLPNVPAGSVKDYTYKSVVALEQMVPTILAAVATRSPAAGVATMAPQVYGGKYGESRAAGRTADQASTDAMFSAAAESIPEAVPLGFMMKPGQKFFAGMLKTAGAEGVQEMFTEALQFAYDKGVVTPEMPWSEAWPRIKEAGIIGAVVGGGMHTIAAPFKGKEKKPAPSDPQNQFGAFADLVPETEVLHGEVLDPEPAQAPARPALAGPAQPKALPAPERSGAVRTHGDGFVMRGEEQPQRQIPSPQAMAPKTAPVPGDKFYMEEPAAQPPVASTDESTGQQFRADAPEQRLAALQKALESNIDPATGQRPKGNIKLREMRERVQGEIETIKLAQNANPPASDKSALVGDGTREAPNDRGPAYKPQGFKAPEGMSAEDAARLGYSVKAPVFDDLPDTAKGDGTAPAPRSFTTAKGSTYEVHEDGTTTRNKAARADAGHEGDSGPKQRSAKTVYVDTAELASSLSAAGLQGLGPKGARVIIKDGKASLLTWNEAAGKWGRAPSGTNIPVSTVPAVGKAPLELWKPADDVPGYEAYRGMHAGNPITETADTPPVTSPAPAPVAPPVRRPPGVKFDPAPHVETVRAMIRDRTSALTMPAIAKRLGISPKQAAAVAGKLVAMPDSGVTLGPKGALRRKPVSTGPSDVASFLAGRGGVKNTESHDLVRGRGLQQFIPGKGHLIRPNGMSVDAAGEALWQAGFFGPADKTERPTERQVLDLLEQTAGRKKVYAPEVTASENERRAGVEAQDANAEAEQSIREAAARHGEELDGDALSTVMADMGARGVDAEDALFDYIERKAIEFDGRDEDASNADDDGATDATDRETGSDVPGFDEEPRVSRGSESARAEASPDSGDNGQARRGPPQQLEIPGAEPSARQLAQSREDAGRGKVKPRVEQEEANTGLFADKRDDVDLFDAPQPKQAEAPASPKSEDVGPEPTPGAPIEDFGEKIHGARKDTFTGFRDALDEDIDVVAEPLSKSFPQPDYEKLAANGVDKRTLAFIALMRDMIPMKPRKSWKLKTWVAQVTELRKFSKRLLDGEVDTASLALALRGAPGLRHLSATAEAIEDVAPADLPKAAEYRIDSGHYSVLNGVRYEPAKTFYFLEGPARRAVKNPFSNDPAMSGTYRTTSQEVVDLAKRIIAYDLAPKEGAPAAKSDYTPVSLYKDRLTGKFFLGWKVRSTVLRVKAGFETVKEAREYLSEKRDEVQATIDEMRKGPNMRGTENRPRTGENLREGDVSPAQFSQAFGFRGVQFGNYVEGPRRQADLNRAFDALMDLADVLSVPPRALSLNGTLGLAFGARGHGGKNAAAAHYEPGTIVINLTKGSGPGSLAHEWLHAADNYFGRQDGASGYMSERRRDTGPVRDVVYRAWKNVERAISNGGFTERSAEFDKVRSKPYWNTTIEKAARAFERYVIDRLADKGAVNDYLANVDLSGGAYPTTEEMAGGIRAAYDQLFEAIETKEEGDNVVMFQRGTGDQPTLTPSVKGQSPAEKLLAAIDRGEVPADPYRALIDAGLPKTAEAFRNARNPMRPELAAKILGDTGRVEESRRARSESAADLTNSYSPEFEAQRDAVAKALRQRLDKLGLTDIGVRVSDAIMARDAEGAIDRQEGYHLLLLITVALDNATPGATIDHEAIHAMRSLGLFTDAEWATLSETAARDWLKRYDIEKRYSDYDSAAQIEEAIAHAFSDWRASRPIGPFAAAKRAFSRLRDALTAIRSAFAGRGFRTVDSVFRDIDTGKVGSRTRAGDAGSATPMFSRKPAEAPKPAAEEKPKREAKVDEVNNINLENLDTTDDIKKVIFGTAEAKGGFAEARRGKVSHEETEALADAMGMTVEDLLKRHKGQAFNAEQTVAARKLLVASAEQVFELSRKAQGGSDLDVFRFQKALTRHVAIQEQVAALTAEAGRALSAFNIAAKAADKTKMLKRVIENGGGRDHLESMANIISTLNDPNAVSKFAKVAYKPTAWDMIMEAWIMALLSGPKTHVVNITSNLLTAIMSVPETALAGALGKLHGGEKVYLREALSKSFGLLAGSYEGVRAGAHAFATEETSDLAAKTDVNRFRAIPTKTFRKGAVKKRIGNFPIPLTGEIEVGGKQVRIPGRALLASDEFFKAIARRQELHAQALRQALKEGLKGDALAKRAAELRMNPTPEMAAAVQDNAEYQTFTDEPGKAIKAVQSLVRYVPPLKLIIPFLRTPAKLIKFAGARTPFALAFPDVRADLLGKNGNAKRDMARARVLLGSAIATAAVTMALEGLITGGPPDDPRERDLLYATGWQPYSFNIGGEYYSYMRLDPFATILGSSADAVQIAEHMDSDEATEIGTMIMGAVSRNLSNKTFLSGISDLISAVQDPERYGEDWLAGLGSSIVPTGVAHIAWDQDPILRDANGIVERIKSRTPGWSKTLKPRRDIFGEPVLRGGGLGPDLLSPIYTTTDKQDPVANELLRLGVEVSRPAKTIGGVELTPDQMDEYRQMMGRLTKRTLQTVISSSGYGRMNDALKTEMLEDFILSARQSATRLMTDKYPAINAQKAQNQIDEMKALVAP